MGTDGTASTLTPWSYILKIAPSLHEHQVEKSRDKNVLKPTDEQLQLEKAPVYVGYH